MQDVVIQSLHDRVQKLRMMLEWIKGARVEDLQVALEQLTELRSELLSSSDLLQHAAFRCAGETARRATSEYRECLERLQEALPILQSALLAERSRLQPERQHVQAAREWVSCSKDTLG